MTGKSRILPLIFMLTLVLCIFAATAFAEGEHGTVSVTASDIVDGRLTATVSISGNPGISGISLKLEFDRLKLTPVSVDLSKSIYPDALSNMTDEGTDPTALDAVTYFFATHSDLSLDGELFRVTFNVSEDATGTTDLRLSYVEGGVTDSDYSTLSPAVQGCTVDISSAEYPAGIILLESEYLGLDYYRVDVSLYGNSCPAALRFKLALSDSISIRSIDFNGILDASRITSNATQPGVALADLTELTYNYTHIENTSAKGKLFSFTLRLVDGFGRIAVKYEEGDVVNSDLEVLSPHKSSLILGTLDVATVSFDVNTDVALSGEAPDDITFTKNSYVTLPFCSEREDKAFFLGWSADRNATSATYPAGSEYLLTGDVTLYAVWTIRTYSISYNANGGSGAPAKQTKIHGTALRLSETVPSKANYDFVGWSVIPNGAADYLAGDVYSENLSVTLYAVWRPHSYLIVFDANGGSGAPVSIAKLYNVDVFLPSSVPARTGYGFAGWANSKTGSVTYLPGQTYGANGDTTLYAVWTSDKYDVVFDAAGGTGAPDDISLAKTLDLTIPETVPEKDGFDFLGWAASKNASVPDYRVGDVYSKKTSVTLYAVWETAKYTVTLDTNGGNGSFSPLTFYHGGSVTLPSDAPTKVGHDFLGWAEDINAVTADFLPGGAYASNRSTTLYAVWSAHKYKVSFNANGGTGAPIAQTKLYGTDLRLSAVVPVLEGYRFLGWSESKDASDPSYRAGTLYTEDREIYLYAIWTPITYTVTYKLNGGSGTVENGIKIHGEHMIICPVNPTKAGYIFRGWSYSPDAITPDFVGGDLYTKNEDAVLFATWVEIEYTILYDANGGESAPGLQKKAHGESLPLVNVKPTREGYVFIGWVTSSDGTEVEYLPGDVYEENADITLYAVWCEAAGAAQLELSATSLGGGRVKIDVLLSANPGIAALQFRLDFDSSEVRLVEVATDEDEEPLSVLKGVSLNFNTSNIPQDLDSVEFSWYMTSNRKTTGVVLSLTFEILPESDGKTDFAVDLMSKTSNASGQKIPTGVHMITFTVPDFIPGDLNDDGVVNAKDSVLLAQHLANWSVVFNKSAADCNGDGTVNAKDSVLLAQYLANWDVTLG